MKLDKFIELGATHNPFAWMPGWFYCKFCRDYKTLISYINHEYETYHFCTTCKNDINDEDMN